MTPGDDIVDRLRSLALDLEGLHHEAADEIERLRTENEFLMREAELWAESCAEQWAVD